MIPDCSIGELRATIFTSPIVYDPSNLQRVTAVLKAENGYMPNVVPAAINGFPFPVPPQIQNPGVPLDWEMASQKTNLRVHFGPQKIDILKSLHQKSPTIENDFCEAALSIFKGIVAQFQLVPTRLAYAPVYSPEYNAYFKRNDFLKKMYATNQFGGSFLNTLLFKQGYVKNETICDMEYKINYVADASEGQSIEERKEPNGTKSIFIHSMLNLVLDINTRQGEGYTFSDEEMSDFFSKCVGWAHLFRDYYVSIEQ